MRAHETGTKVRGDNDAMGKSEFKRKGSVVKAVRRQAVGHVDRLLELLDHGRLTAGQRAAARSEARALASLIETVRGPLGPEVVRRELRWLKRLRATLAGAAGPAAGDETGWRAEAEELGLSTEAAARVAAACVASASGRESGGEPPTSARPTRATETGNDADGAAPPDPVLLRRRADVAEARMRARHWHLPTGDFDLLAPGLRRSYGRARQHAAAWRDADDAGHTDALPAAAALAEALGQWAVALRRLEKAWPEVLKPTRKATQDAADLAHRCARLGRLQASSAGHDPAADAALQEAADHARRNLRPALDRLLVESPPATVKRIEAYWRAWRG